MESKELTKKKSFDVNKEKALRRKALNAEKRNKIVNIFLFLVLAVIVVSGGLVIYLNSVPMKDDSPAFMKNLYDLNYNIFPRPEKIAAVVNDEKISSDELDKRYNMLPPEYQPYVTKTDLLDQLIDEKVLLDKAAKEGISVSDADVDSYLVNLSNASGVSIQEFEMLLTQRGLTLDEVKAYYKRSLILNELLGSKVLSKAIVSGVDVEDYYNKNPDQFIVPESANISHILICYNESQRCPSNLSKTEALSLAKDVRKMVDSTNFEDLALKYSYEPAAKVTKGALGWVTMDIPFDKNFLNETFKLNSGELSQPIETVFGYHIIKVWEKRKEDKIDLASAYEQINQSLTQQLQSNLYFEYVSGLRNQSKIIVYEK